MQIKLNSRGLAEAEKPLIERELAGMVAAGAVLIWRADPSERLVLEVSGDLGNNRWLRRRHGRMVRGYRRFIQSAAGAGSPRDPASCRCLSRQTSSSQACQ
jgi:hypothetical protein